MKRTGASDPTFRVVPHNPVRRRWLWLVTGLVVLGVGLSGYYLGGSWAWNEIRMMSVDLSRNQTLIQEQDRQVARLKQQLAIAERSGQINRDAAEIVRKDVRRLKDEHASLNQDLAFYRSILAPDDGGGAVSVQKFELLATDNPRHFQWKLVVMQSAKQHPFLKGELQATVVGTKDGNPVSFDLHELSPQLDDQRIRLGFRYFQHIPDEGVRGEIVLPEGFVPEYLQVTARINSPKKREIERKFNWIVKEA